MYKIGEEVVWINKGKLEELVVTKIFGANELDFDCQVKNSDGRKMPMRFEWLMPSPIAKIEERIAVCNKQWRIYYKTEGDYDKYSKLTSKELGKKEAYEDILKLLKR